MALDAAMLPQPHPSVIFQGLENGAVLFAPDTEMYFGLNETGVAVWELLTRPGASLDSICAELLVRFPEAPSDQVRADVEALLGELAAEGLITSA